MTKDQKIKEIKKLTRQQLSLMKKSIKIAGKPTPKRWQTSFDRACKIVAIAFQIRSLELQKSLVISTPTNKFKFGAVMPKGIAIVGDSDKKEIIIP